MFIKVLEKQLIVIQNERKSIRPNSKLFWFEKCGHAPMMEHPVENM